MERKQKIKGEEQQMNFRRQAGRRKVEVHGQEQKIKGENQQKNHSKETGNGLKQGEST
jgi:hypothetical protein